MKITNQNQEYTELRAKARLYELIARIRSGFGAFGHNPICWAWTVAYWLPVPGGRQCRSQMCLGYHGRISPHWTDKPGR